MQEATDLANNTPCYIVRDISIDEAEQIKVMLEDAGATVSIIGVEEIED